MSLFDLHFNLTLTFYLLSNIFEISNFRFKSEEVARGDSYHSTKWKQELVLRQAAKSYVDSTSWRTGRCSIDFESRIGVELSTSNKCHPFHNDWSFIINEIPMSFCRKLSMPNRQQIDEDVSIECMNRKTCCYNPFMLIELDYYIPFLRFALHDTKE